MVVQKRAFASSLEKNMDNKTFYMRYQDYQAIPIDTLYIGEQLRIRPLSSIGHLVAAYKTAASPLLDNISIAQLSIHVNVNSEALKSDVSLSTIPSGNTVDTPLILKFNKAESQDASSHGIRLLETLFLQR